MKLALVARNRNFPRAPNRAAIRALAALAAASAGLALAGGAMSCGFFRHDVKINLVPDGALTIVSRPPTGSGETDRPLKIDPASAGKDYTDNKKKLDSASLKSLKLTIAKLYPDNKAGRLLTPVTVTLTNLRTMEKQTYAVGEIAIAQDAENTLTLFTPDPSSFVTSALKNADSFTLEVAGAVDSSPVYVDVRAQFAVTLSVNPL